MATSNATSKHLASVTYGEASSSGNAEVEDAYPCAFCKTAKPSLEELRAHFEQKHAGSRKPEADLSEKKHRCSYCDYRSRLVGHLKRHLLIHTGEKPFECGHCGYRCRDKTVLRRHVERHAKNEHLQRSRRSTTDGRQYMCAECDFSTHAQAALSRHFLQHSNPKLCPHCGAKFWKDSSYRNHFLLHLGVASHPCMSCDYKTNKASDLTKHVKRMHSDKSLMCSECNYATNCPSDLSKHKAVHRSDRPYKCKECDYTAKRRGHLMCHMVTHDRDLQKYECPFCNFRTILISTLKVHVRSHTGERPYECKECGSTFTSSGGVKAHAYTHLKNWSQTCSLCDFTATKPLQFRRHLKSHETSNAISTKRTPNSPKLTSKLTARKARPIKGKVPQKGPINNIISTFNVIKTDPDGTMIKIEPAVPCFVPTLLDLDEPVKTEVIDTSYPVKEESNLSKSDI